MSHIQKRNRGSIIWASCRVSLLESSRNIVLTALIPDYLKELREQEARDRYSISQEEKREPLGKR